MEPKLTKKKMNIVDIIFIILLLIMLLFLIPFYSSIVDIVILSTKLEVGTDVYVGLLGFIFSLFIMFLGFKYKNGATRIFALLLAFCFAISPFMGYFESKNAIKYSLGNYSFKKLTVIQPSECQIKKQVQEQISNKLEENFGSDMQVEVETTTQTDNSLKEKISCMPTKTHFAYVVEYKDADGEKRTVTYDAEENFDDELKTQSYNILYGKVGEYLREKVGNKKISYTFYLAHSQRGLLELTKSLVISEKFSLPSPTTINLKNFYTDKRFVLEVTFNLVTKQEEAHEMIEELVNLSNSSYPVLVHYGKTTEYFFNNTWTTGDKDELWKKIKEEL